MDLKTEIATIQSKLGGLQRPVVTKEYSPLFDTVVAPDKAAGILVGLKGGFFIDFKKKWSGVPTFFSVWLNQRFKVEYIISSGKGAENKFSQMDDILAPGRHKFINRPWDQVKIRPLDHPAQIIVWVVYMDGPGYAPVLDEYVVDRGTMEHEHIEFIFPASGEVTFVFDPRQALSGITPGGGGLPPHTITAAVVNIPRRPSNLLIDSLQVNADPCFYRVNSAVFLRRLQKGDAREWQKAQIERVFLKGTSGDTAIVETH